MAGGFAAKQRGVPAIADRFASLQRQIDAVRSGGNVNIAVTGPTTAAGTVAITVPGLKLDGVTDDGPAIQKALDKVKSGNRATEVLVHGNSGKVVTIASTVQVESDFTTLRFDIPIVAQPGCKLRIFGTTVELPEFIKPKLEVDAPMGTTVLTLSDVSYFYAGALATIRGLRDSNGLPLQRESFTIVSVDTGALTITIEAPGLLDGYVTDNDTTWSNRYTQVTVVVASAMTGTPTRGDSIVEVLDSSLFPIGATVQAIDDQHTQDDGGAIQTGNYCHREIAQVVDILSSTEVLLSHPLFHTYNLAENARLALISDVVGSEIVDANVTFSEVPEDSENAFECRYGLHSGMRNCRVVGLPGKSWKTQAFRLTDSLDCWIDNCSAIGPDDVTAGRGYGAAMYGATMCSVIGGIYTGCRHSVLVFNGASGNIIYGVRSSGVRISDFDAHGADCNSNLFFGCRSEGGLQNTPDSTYRTAFKIGNPSHYPGDNDNVVEGCTVQDFLGVAFEIIPNGSDNVFKNNTVRNASIGFKAGNLTIDTTLTAARAILANNDFYDVPTPFEVDGGPDEAVTGLWVDGNRWHRCGPMSLTGVPDVRITKDAIVDPAASTSYVLSIASGARAKVSGNDYSGAYRGPKLTDCPDARVFGNVLHDLQTTVVFDDGGGNGGMLFRGNEIFGYLPTITNSGGTPSAGLLDIGDAYADDTPESHGLTEWNLPPTQTVSGTGQVMTAGTYYLMRLTPKRGRPFSNVVVGCGTIQSGSAVYFAVSDSAGNQLAVTGDVSASFNSTGPKTISLGSTLGAIVGLDLYVSALAVGGTPPALVRGPVSVVVPNVGLGSSSLRFATNGTGLSSVPSSFTPSSNTGVGALGYWVALS